jgi:hypothetical protein
LTRDNLEININELIAAEKLMNDKIVDVSTLEESLPRQNSTGVEITYDAKVIAEI